MVGNRFLESTGLYGKSYLHFLSLDEEKKTVKIDIKTQHKLNKKYFGEGCEYV